MKFILLAASVLTLSGCSTKPTKFKYLSVGMPKSEAIKTLGNPNSVSAQEGVEYLVYEYDLNPLTGEPGLRGPDRHFVRIKDGHVDAYGRVGDFNSTKNHEETINVNMKQK